jgi:hypothetical protein
MKLIVTTMVIGMVTLTLMAQSPTQSPMRPGNWEITTQMQIPDVPVQMPETRITQCVTPEDLKDPAAALPNALQQGRGRGRGRGNADACKVSDYAVSGSTVTWKLTCTGDQAMNGTAEMVFAGDSYTGMMKMAMQEGAVAIRLTGKRTGDCTK